MTRLRDLVLRTSYHKGRDDIASDFYLPCMHRASEYDRAVGFFRSSVFAVAWPALREFVGKRGRLRFLCSHVLSETDTAALTAGYSARIDEHLAEQYLAEVRSLLSDSVLRDPTRMLAGLVAQGILDLKIAVTDRPTAPARAA